MNRNVNNVLAVVFVVLKVIGAVTLNRLQWL
jgi:hypothetical protein